MATNNSVNLSSEGITGYDGSGNFTGTPVVAHNVLVGGASSDVIVNVTPSTVGFVLTSNGATADPSFQSASPGASVTFTGDTGTPFSTSSVTIFANTASNNSGSSVSFDASTPNMTLNVTDASQNTLIGNGAGNATLTGTGCTSVGFNTLDALTSGNRSTAVGVNALSLTTADSDHVAIGANALQNMNGGIECVAVGSGALTASTADSLNNAIGYHALNLLNGGIQNCAFGGSSGASLTTGAQNLLLGNNSGTSYTSSESGNVLLNSSGVLGESHVLRIGAATGTSGRDLSTAFICGINGNTVANTQMVTIDSSTNQLGVMAVPVPGLTWTDQATSFTAAAYNGYFATAALTATLPTSPSEGQTITIYADTGSSVVVQAATGQTIRIGASASSSGGTATSATQGNSVTLVYRSASTTWNSPASQGTWVLA